MEHKLTVTLPDEIYQPLIEAALRQGRTPEEVVVEQLAKSTLTTRRASLSVDEARDAEARFARHFGAWDSGDPHSADNDRIDADLAREYAATHDEP